MDRLYQAFIARQDEKNGPIIFFVKVWDIRMVARVILFVVQVVIFDAVLVRDFFWCRAMAGFLTRLAFRSSARTLSGKGACG